MARPAPRTPKFHVPQAMNEPPLDENAGEAGHPHAGFGKYLINHKTGEVYPWTDRMAERGDILYASDELPVDPEANDPLRDLSFLSQPPERILPNGSSRAS